MSTPPLRVAVLAPACMPWHPPGGLERHVFELCRWLRRRGAEVDLFTSAPARAADPFAGDAGFRLHVVPGVPYLRRRGAVVVSRGVLYPLFSLRMGRQVAAVVAGGGHRAVVAQGLTGFGYAVRRARSPALPPLVVNPQGMEEAITPELLKRVLYLPLRAATRWGARRAAAIVATDRSLVDVVARVFGVPPGRIVLLPNAVDVAACRAHATPEARRAVRERLGIGAAAPLLVTVGRLAPNKGHGMGLEALARAAARLPPGWRWQIAGDGPLRDQLPAAARRLGLAERVGFARDLDDAALHALVAEADVFLNPTLYEGSSLVTLEAMSHARPIVASRAGGIPDKIEDGVTGWLAAPGDPDSLAAALLRALAAGEAERARVGDAALALCRERFDWPVSIDAWLETIRSLPATDHDVE